jgi:hypothetical protein
MTLLELAELAQRMRMKQKLYFRGRNPGVLQESKILEKELDVALAEILNPQNDDEIGLFGPMSEMRSNNAVERSGFKS